MCDRCGTGLTFFGLAEPQVALIDAYRAALTEGWRPAGTATADELAAAVAADSNAFLSERADTVVRVASAADAAAVRSIRLVRWLWDGAFCGEVSLAYDASAPIGARVGIATSIVPWKDGLGYAERARRHLLLEARDLAVALPDLDDAELQER